MARPVRDAQRGNRLWRQVGALVAALTLVAAACGDADDDAGGGTTLPAADGVVGGDEIADRPDATSGGRLVVALEADVVVGSWVPGAGSLGGTGAFAVYDPLVRDDADQQPQPYLAESVTPDDDLDEWTVTLRSGVAFHDGTPLDAEVLKWNFDTLHADPSATTYGQVRTAGIESVEVVDELTVRYVLSGPNAALPDVLQTAVGMPISRDAYERLGREAFGEAPVGTGPFVLEEWTRDDRFVGTRNPSYWRTDADGVQLPYLDAIEVRAIPDEQSRVQSLASGTVDVIVTLRGTPTREVLDLAEQDGYGAFLFAGSQSNGILFNVLAPPVDDLRVRQALLLSTSPEEFAQITGEAGVVPVSDGFFSSQSGWYSEDAAAAFLSRDGIDMDRARALVEEYKADPARSDARPVGSGLELALECPSNPINSEVSQYAQSQWGEIDITTTISLVDFAVAVQNGMGAADQDPPWSGHYQATCWRVGAEGDPLTTLANFFGPPLATPSNVTNFTSPEIDAALVTLRTSADPAARWAAAETITRVTNENALVAWRAATPIAVGWVEGVHGIVEWTLPDGTAGAGAPGGAMVLSQTFLVDG